MLSSRSAKISVVRLGRGSADRPASLLRRPARSPDLKFYASGVVRCTSHRRVKRTSSCDQACGAGMFWQARTLSREALIGKWSEALCAIVHFLLRQLHPCLGQQVARFRILRRGYV